MDYKNNNNPSNEEVSEYNPRVFTDEEIENDEYLYKNEDGVYMIINGAPALVQPSERWILKNTYVPEEPEPTQEDYNMDFDLRLSMIELGI